MIARRDLFAAGLAGLPAEVDTLRLSLPSAAIVQAQWRDGIDRPVNPGSLWKPFLAAIPFAGAPPQFHCDGSRCWLGRRHGSLGMEAAIAQSCNQWFLAFAAAVSLANVNIALRQFGLPPQNDLHWMVWRCTPRRLAIAYAELMARGAHHPAVIAGLRQAAVQGTARAIGPDYLAKTGTSPAKRHAGDGWVMAAWPAGAPRHLILERRAGTTGAIAAQHLARRLCTL